MPASCRLATGGPTACVAKPGRVRLRRLIALVAVLVLAGLFVAPVRSYRSAQDRLADARRELTTAQTARMELERRREELGTRAALVREARSRHYVFPGETPYAVELP
jgi:cell division protein FtsB